MHKKFPLGISFIMRFICKEKFLTQTEERQLLNSDEHIQGERTESLTHQDNIEPQCSISQSYIKSKRDVNYKLVHKYCPFFILMLTFLIYTFFHASRRPISVVKSALHHTPNCSSFINVKPNLKLLKIDSNTSSSCKDWPPFDGSNYNQLFGALDMAYLFSYAIAMFFSGHLAEHTPIRIFLIWGMIGSGFFTVLFGLGYFLDIHSIFFYFGVQVAGGIFQSTGWPSVVACVGNWFGKRKKGLIFGLWNSHTSFGNILGSLLASVWVNHAWGWSFIVPGVLLCCMSLLVWLFLIPSPEDFEDGYRTWVTSKHKDLASNNGKLRRSASASTTSLLSNEYYLENDSSAIITTNGTTSTSYLNSNATLDEHSHLLSDPHRYSDSTLPLLPNNNLKSLPKKPIGIGKALRVPGVLEFSLCLFFAKAVSYTFLFWLPNYISSSTSLNPGKAAQLASIFDFGGILGGIVAGYVSDKTEASATICAVMLGLSCPLMYYYHLYGNVNYIINICLLFTTGLFVNGPYALITTAVSADLGNKIGHSQHAKALATVTAIIDGSGSLGAALGPLLTGLIAAKSWWNVFVMLIVSDILAILFLIRLSYREMKLVYTVKKDRII